MTHTFLSVNGSRTASKRSTPLPDQWLPWHRYVPHDVSSWSQENKIEDCLIPPRSRQSNAVSQYRPLGRIDDTFKNGILNPLTIVFTGFGNPAQSFCSALVTGYQHKHNSPLYLYPSDFCNFISRDTYPQSLQHICWNGTTHFRFNTT